MSVITSFDEFILQAVNLSFHNVYTDLLAFALSWMGVVFFWIVICVLLYLFGNNKAKSVSKIMILTLVLVYLVTFVIKDFVLRPRPYTELTNLIVVDYQNDYSFPSGHTAVSAAMSYILAKEYDKSVIMIIPLIVAFTRLYMGVHYPTDILGGFIIALTVAYLTDYFMHFMDKKI